jgi:hypothetical protein
MNEQSDSSYKRLKTALVDFVERSDPGAFLLRGEWGVGKTYTCLECMKAEKGRNQRAFSYVSLYGVSSANDIYTRIALGWLNKITTAFPEWIGEISEQGGCIAKLIDAFSSKGKQVTAVGTAALGLMARNTIVIIDDLERRDKELSIQAAIGVISYVVESRNCRVILISNDDKLDCDDKKVFELQKEKLFDFEMIYAPTVDENANLAVDEYKDIIIPILHKLDIRNIRVMRRIANTVSHFDQKLAGISENVRVAFVPNVAVIAALHYNYRDKVDFKELKTASTLSRSHQTKRPQDN